VAPIAVCGAERSGESDAVTLATIARDTRTIARPSEWEVAIREAQGAWTQHIVRGTLHDGQRDDNPQGVSCWRCSYYRDLLAGDHRDLARSLTVWNGADTEANDTI
jgi:hypothetical protein